MNVVNVVIAGLGRVGTCIATSMLQRRQRYAALYGLNVRLVGVATSKRGAANGNGLEISDLKHLDEGLCGAAHLMALSPDILIEAGPTDFISGGPALEHLKACLGQGCSAVVVSKGALVHSGDVLQDLAARNGACLRISGATAAALPTIDLIDTGLLGCEILQLEGVLNATTNYLLNAMMARGIEYSEALEEAQRGGFAEADPSRDVDGWDTACKLLILANFGLGARLRIEDVAVSGIADVAASDVARWRAAGLVPRLVGSLTTCRDGRGHRYKAGVGLRTYPTDDPFAHISGKQKALRVQTDVMGEIITIGGGPEPMATASAALKDLELILADRVRSGQKRC